MVRSSRTGWIGLSLGFVLALGAGAGDWEGETGVALNLAQGGLQDWKSEYRAVFEGDRYVCKNAKGEVGYNQVSPEEVLKSREGECAYLVGIRWHGQELSKTNLKGADLNAAVLTGSNLTRADLRGAQLMATLDGALLEKTDLRWANLTQAHLSHAQATAAVLRYANLHRAYLVNAVLNGAYLMDANLSGAFLNRAWLWGANLRNANLLGTDMTQARIDEDTVFTGAKYDSETRLPFSEREAEKRGMVKIGF